MAAYSPGDVVHAIVADVGHYSTKMGFAGEDYPRSYFRSTVATRRSQPTEDSAPSSKPTPGARTVGSIQDVKYDYFTRPIGYPDDTDGNYQVMNPVDRTTGLWYDSPLEDHPPMSQHNSNSTGGGSATDGGADWHDLMQTLLHHGYHTALRTAPEEHPLMLMERSYNPPPIRQQVIECLFEEMKVPAAFLGRDATMACYGCGRTTSTVVDMGYQGTVVTPVYDGYVEQKGIRRSPMGARAMDEAILSNLDDLATTRPFLPLYQVRKFGKRADAFHIVARLDVARQAREAGAGATVAASTLEGGSYSVPHVSFELPDGQQVSVPSKQRFAVADLLLGKDEGSVTQREEAVSKMQKDFTLLVTAASHTNEDGDKDDDNYESDKHKEIYSEAAAVGMAQRKKGSDKKTTTGKVPFSNRHLQRACVSYLQGHMEQLTAAAVPAMVCDSAFHCDRDQQASLLGNVVLTGGGACLGPTDQAVPEALREQMEAIIHTHTPGWRVKVLSPGMQERAILSWLGGSILGSLGTFDKMWISQAEYEEWGPAIVNRKCP